MRHVAPSPLAEIVAAQHRGRAVGLPAVCSAHPFVLDAALRHALRRGRPLLVESTCHQVNQGGGYTGLTPAAFQATLHDLAARLGFPPDRLLLGGDHLGPAPWQHQPAAQALAEAHTLVRDYVRAGYVKIHLDASMPCADDPPGPLDRATAAARATELCSTAEQAAEGAGPVYVIGTEVPLPGGLAGSGGPAEDVPVVTGAGDAQETIDLTRRAFQARGLGAAWERVMAVVVQPGVDFGDGRLVVYDPAAAAPLRALIEAYPGLVYEAHSTDYQPPAALRALVAGHFAVLKVGPALTFAFREAVFALDLIEAESLAGRRDASLSDLRRVLDEVMVANPAHWRAYYSGSEADVRLARRYSLSDRARYYWPTPPLRAALDRLLANLDAHPPPLPLLSQFLPVQYERVRAGALPNTPRALIADKIEGVLENYAAAGGTLEDWEVGRMEER